MTADLQALRLELAAYKGLTSRLCDTLGITPAGGTAPDKAAFAALEGWMTSQKSLTLQPKPKMTK